MAITQKTELRIKGKKHILMVHKACGTRYWRSLESVAKIEKNLSETDCGICSDRSPLVRVQ